VVRLAFRIAAVSVVAITGLGSAVTASAAALGSHSSERGAAHYGAAAGAGGTKLWVSRYGRADESLAANSVVASPDGSMVFVTGGPTVAYDTANGAMRWVTPGATAVSGTAAVVSPGGSTLFVTGTSAGPGGTSDYGTEAYDSATGAGLWAASYHGPGTGSDRATAVAVSPDGSEVFVTGQSSNGTGSTTGFATVAYDASTGAQLWVTRYDGPVAGIDRAVAVAVSPDGSTVFVTGASLGQNRIYSYITLAYRAATGATVWTQRYNQGSRNATAAALAVGPGGSTVYVTGASHGSHGQDATTVAYAADAGTRLWTAQYDGPSGTGNSPTSIAVSPDGSSVFVTGQTKTTAAQYVYSTQAYHAASGARIWAKTYGGPAGFGLAESVVVNPAGSRVYVTGYTNSATPDATEYATLAYNTASGAALWTRLYTGPDGGANQASSAAMDPDGSAVFVTGGSLGTSGESQFATVAYHP
jgi:DNA-binding beta-propeller fold protein YncE